MHVSMVLVGGTVRLTLTSVLQTPVRTMASVTTMSIPLRVRVGLVLVALIVSLMTMTAHPGEKLCFSSLVVVVLLLLLSSSSSSSSAFFFFLSFFLVPFPSLLLLVFFLS